MLGSPKAYAYVPQGASADFNAYARACGLTSQSELLKLLIHRELQLRRLLRSQSGLRQPPLRGRKKITAHLTPELDARFSSHTNQLGLSTSGAAALLVEAELSERWLQAALDWEPPR